MCAKTVSRENFHVINNSFVDALLLEAVELDDLDSIEGILSWRNVKARKYREFPGLPITFDHFFVVVAKGSDAVHICLVLGLFAFVFQLLALFLLVSINKSV